MSTSGKQYHDVVVPVNNKTCPVKIISFSVVWDYPEPNAAENCRDGKKRVRLERLQTEDLLGRSHQN